MLDRFKGIVKATWLCICFGLFIQCLWGGYEHLDVSSNVYHLICYILLLSRMVAMLA